jgi:hypothetical protein
LYESRHTYYRYPEVHLSNPKLNEVPAFLVECHAAFSAYFSPHLFAAGHFRLCLVSGHHSGVSQCSLGVIGDITTKSPTPAAPMQLTGTEISFICCGYVGDSFICCAMICFAQAGD